MEAAAEIRDSQDSGVIGRRSARLSIIAPVIIRGIDTEGKAFKENTWTISVNKHGARLSTFYRLKVGAEVSVENPIFGRTAKGRVVRASEKHYPEDPYEISVELTEPANVWGVKFPPEDWQRAGWPAMGGMSPGRAPAIGVALKPENTSTCSAAKPPMFTLPTTRRFPDPPGLTSDTSRQKAYSPAVARRCGITSNEGSQPSTGDGEPLPIVAAENSAMLSRIAEAASQLEEKQKAFQSLARELGALADRLESSQSELQVLVSNAEELQRGLRSSDEQVKRFGAMLETSRSQTVESLAQQARKITAEFRDEVNTARQDYRQAIQKELEALAQEAIAEQRAALQEHMKSQIDELGEEAFKQVRSRFEQISQETCDDVHKHIGVAAVAFKNLTDKSKELFESSFQKSLEAFRERIDSFSNSVLEELHKNASLVTNDIRGRLQRAADAFDEKARKGFGPRSE